MKPSIIRFCDLRASDINAPQAQRLGNEVGNGQRWSGGFNIRPDHGPSIFSWPSATRREMRARRRGIPLDLSPSSLHSQADDQRGFTGGLQSGLLRPRGTRFTVREESETGTSRLQQESTASCVNWSSSEGLTKHHHVLACFRSGAIPFWAKGTVSMYTWISC